jgi:hypothetical protein
MCGCIPHSDWPSVFSERRMSCSHQSGTSGRRFASFVLAWLQPVNPNEGPPRAMLSSPKTYSPRSWRFFRIATACRLNWMIKGFLFCADIIALQRFAYPTGRRFATYFFHSSVRIRLGGTLHWASKGRRARACRRRARLRPWRLRMSELRRGRLAPGGGAVRIIPSR